MNRSEIVLQMGIFTGFIYPMREFLSNIGFQNALNALSAKLKSLHAGNETFISKTQQSVSGSFQKLALKPKEECYMKKVACGAL